MNQKGFTPILIVLLIAVIGGYLFFTNYSNSRTKIESQNQVVTSKTTQSTSIPSSTANTTDETANWKTYTYKDFVLKYPSDWNLKEDKKVVNLKDFPFEQILSVESPKIDSLDLSLYSFSILKRDNKEKMTLEQVVKRLEAQLGSGGHALDIVGKTTLGDKEAYQLHYVVDTGEQMIIIVAINKNTIYHVGLSVVSDQHFELDDLKAKLEDDFKSIVNQIFSNFKFTQ